MKHLQKLIVFITFFNLLFSSFYPILTYARVADDSDDYSTYQDTTPPAPPPPSDDYVFPTYSEPTYYSQSGYSSYTQSGYYTQPSYYSQSGYSTPAPTSPPCDPSDRTCNSYHPQPTAQPTAVPTVPPITTPFSQSTTVTAYNDMAGFSAADSQKNLSTSRSQPPSGPAGYPGYLTQTVSNIPQVVLDSAGKVAGTFGGNNATVNQSDADKKLADASLQAENRNQSRLQKLDEQFNASQQQKAQNVAAAFDLPPNSSVSDVTTKAADIIQSTGAKFHGDISKFEIDMSETPTGFSGDTSKFRSPGDLNKKPTYSFEDAKNCKPGSTYYTGGCMVIAVQKVNNGDMSKEEFSKYNEYLNKQNTELGNGLINIATLGYYDIAGKIDQLNKDFTALKPNHDQLSNLFIAHPTEN